MAQYQKVSTVNAEVALSAGVTATNWGDQVYDKGDYLVTNPDGETYPVKPHVFLRDYVPVQPEFLTFGDVVAGLKEGNRYARKGWNGKGMFIFLVGGSRFHVNREPLLSILGEGTEVDYHAHVDMRTATGQIVPWLCSQSDLLAEDWEEV